MFRLIVTRLNGALVCELDAEPTWTVRDVKELIQESDGACPCKQQLVAESEILRDTDVLEGCAKKGVSVLALALVVRNISAYDRGAQRDDAADARDLRADGFCAACLQSLGFSGDVLGFAGFDAGELLKLGFHLRDISCCFELRQLREAGVSVRELEEDHCLYTNCHAWDRMDGHDMNVAGADAARLSAAGYRAKDLLEVGFNPQFLEDYFDAQELREAGAFAILRQVEERQQVDALLGCGFKALLKSACQVQGIDYASMPASVRHPTRRCAPILLEKLRHAGIDARDLRSAGFPAWLVREAALLDVPDWELGKQKHARRRRLAESHRTTVQCPRMRRCAPKSKSRASRRQRRQADIGAAAPAQQFRCVRTWTKPEILRIHECMYEY